MTRTLYPSLVNPPTAFTSAVPRFESTWHQPWSEPVRQKIAPALAIALITASGLFAPVLNPDTQITQKFESRWHQGWSEPVRTKLGLAPHNQQFLAYMPFFPAAGAPSGSGDARTIFPGVMIYQEIAEPVYFTTTPEVITADKWIYPWSEPVRVRTFHASQQQATAYGALPITTGFESLWHYPWSEPVRFRVLHASQQQATAYGALPITTGFESLWHYPWSEPVRVRYLPTSEQQALAFIQLPTAEVITADKWAYPWSEPVRFRTFHPSQQQALAYGAVPITAKFESLWHFPWSEPVRLKSGLSVALQQFTTPQTPIYPNLNRLIQWFANLSEPVRQKPGLPVSLQHYLEFTALKPPQAPVSISMSAKEINGDVALFGLYVYNVLPTPYVLIAGANVSIKEIPATKYGNVSIEET